MAGRRCVRGGGGGGGIGGGGGAARVAKNATRRPRLPSAFGAVRMLSSSSSSGVGGDAGHGGGRDGGAAVVVDRSGGLSHVSADGRMPRMVDVGGKHVTQRTAVARATLTLPPHVMEQLGVPPATAAPASDAAAAAVGGRPLPAELMSKKGPVFATAVVAGVQAAKRTWELIPFCHPLLLERCDVDVSVASATTVAVTCTVGVHHRTGVEMEALTGASVAALTVYDMCKALSHDIVVSDVRLVKKTGGKSDYGAATSDK